MSNSSQSSSTIHKRRLLSPHNKRSVSPQLPVQKSTVLQSLILSNISLNVQKEHLMEIIPNCSIAFPFRKGNKSNMAMIVCESKRDANDWLKRLDFAIIDGMKVRARFMNKEDESFI